MPLYEFECEDCHTVTTILWRSNTREEDIACKHCRRHRLKKLVSRISVHRDLSSRLSGLDPKYDKMVDRAAANTPEADPNRHLSRMKPFKD